MGDYFNKIFVENLTLLAMQNKRKGMNKMKEFN